MSWTDRALAARELAERIKKPVEKQEIEWTAPNFVHRLSLEPDPDTKPGEVQLVYAVCKCGWRSDLTSQHLAREQWRNHTDDLWEVNDDVWEVA